MLNQVLGEHMQIFDFYSQSVLLWYLDTYIYKLKNQNIFKCVSGPDPISLSIIQIDICLWHYFILHTNGKRCSQEGFRSCYSQSQVVYAYNVLNL